MTTESASTEVVFIAVVPTAWHINLNISEIPRFPQNYFKMPLQNFHLTHH